MSNISVHGQKPRNFDPLDHEPTLTDDPNTGMTGYEYNTAMAKIMGAHFRDPLVATTPVVYRDDKGNELDDEHLGDLLAIPMIPNYDVRTHNANAQQLLSQILAHIDTSIVHSINNVFLAQLYGPTAPPPSGNVYYTPAADIIPAAKKYLIEMSTPGTDLPDRTIDMIAQVNLALGSAYHPEALGVAFANEEAFKAFATDLSAKASAMLSAGTIDGAVSNKLNQVAGLPFDGLTESLVIRTFDDGPGDENCFARVLHRLIVDYARQEQATARGNDGPVMMGLSPFHAANWIMPRTIIFYDIEAHARADASLISAEWQAINRRTRSKLHVIDMRKLTKLETADEVLANAISQSELERTKQRAQRRAAIASDFADNPPAATSALRDILALVKKIGKVNRSSNPQVYRKKTVTRPSRRRPNDPAAAGRYRNKRYQPDIHFYADLSASMSMKSHLDTVMLLMGVASKLGVDFYFSSFSHILSQEVKIPVKGRTQKQIYDMIMALPKVGGWTDFAQIYDYINISAERGRRLNIIATDLEWWPGSGQTIRHPNNTFYVPAFDRSQPHEWDAIRYNAAKFTNAMVDHEPQIDSMLLGMR